MNEHKVTVTLVAETTEEIAGVKRDVLKRVRIEDVSLDEVVALVRDAEVQGWFVNDISTW